MTAERPPDVMREPAAAPQDEAMHADAARQDPAITLIEPEVELLATQLEWVLGIALMWAIVGLCAALVLRRRGHEFVPAAVVGAAFGPLFIPIARRELRTYVPGEPAIVVAQSPAGTGTLDVLVSVHTFDLPNGVGAIVDDCVGPNCRRLTIAGAIDYQSAESGTLSRTARRTAHRLELAAITVTSDHRPGRVLLGGPSPEALIQYARRNRYNLVVLAPDEPSPRVDADGPLVIRADAQRD